MEQMRIVREMRAADQKRGCFGVDIRPRWVCWENVPGAFSSGTPKYEDFRIVLEEIVRLVTERTVDMLMGSMKSEITPELVRQSCAKIKDRGRF